MYDPGATAGRRLLAHELAHVVQQSRGGAPPDPWDTGSPIERDADRASNAVSQPGGAVQVSSASAAGVVRAGDEKKPDPQPPAAAASPQKTYTIEDLLEPPTLEEIAASACPKNGGRAGC